MLDLANSKTGNYEIRPFLNLLFFKLPTTTNKDYISVVTFVSDMLNQDSTQVADMRDIKSDPREIFDKYDVDRSGCITFDEFKAMLPQFNFK